MIVHSLLPPFAAQTASPATGGPGFGIFIAEIALLIVAFYFVLARPQQKKRKQQEQTLRSLRKGDEVVTAGGIVGEVIHIKETIKEGTPEPTMEDRITIKSGESRIVVERGRIASVTRKTADTAAGGTA
ncbi:MAG TPA: preprotein translocase subunit YajC [Gemmatimonadaceae bacterium]|jgi:preprotein translocase subunit YajC